MVKRLVALLLVEERVRGVVVESSSPRTDTVEKRGEKGVPKAAAAGLRGVAGIVAGVGGAGDSPRRRGGEP